MNESLMKAPMGVIKTTPTGEITDLNERAKDLLDTEQQQSQSNQMPEAFPKSAAGTLQDAFADSPPAAVSFEEYYPGIDRWLGIDITRIDHGVVVYVRDRTEQHETEQQLEQLERRLWRVEAIDSLMVTVLQKLIAASGREEVWQTVCDRLGTTDIYEFAWIGERDLTSGQLQVAANAGAAPELLEVIGDHLELENETPEQIAVAQESTQLVEKIADDESIPRPLRVAAFGSGLQSSIAVPLAQGDTVYGVLGVYSARKDGFSEQEQVGLETLGAIAGFAVDALRQETLLFADTVIELTFAVEDETIPLVATCREMNCQLTLEGVVSRDDNTVVCYLQSDTTPGNAAETLDSYDGVTSVRTIDEESAVFEVAVIADSPVAAVTSWGAAVEDATYTENGVELVATLPSDEHPRALIEPIDEKFTEVEVLAKEERPRNPETMQTFRSNLSEALTEKQRRVLRTAHLSEYFESPRGSTSEEMAEALDISGPTVLYHLRNAQQKLLDAFFLDSNRTQ